MTTTSRLTPNPKFDLVLERIVDLPAEKIWQAWTTPEIIVHWFTPAPWQTTECHIDLRPGGQFRTVMRSPEGECFPNEGCFLEVVEHRKLVWTNAMMPGFRPVLSKLQSSCGDFLYTAAVMLESAGSKTKYTALIVHADEAGRKQHEEMGFHEGWGIALDQLIAYMKKQ